MSISSFNGVISEIPGIAVDNFEAIDKRAYFLSHCHRDHTQGLTNLRLKRHLEECNVFIYTSEVSAAIIGQTADFAFVRDNIKILNVGTTTVKLNKTDDYQELYIQVKTIPAAHCFGSVMFLFKTPNKSVLFTGDFRISANDVSKFGQLHEKNGDPVVIDKIYADTTFFNTKYENFPKRSDCIDSAITEIRNWLESCEDNLVAVHPSARLGYEYVFNEIFKQLGTKVYIGDDWNLYRSFPHLVPGVTNNVNQTKIHKCRNRNEQYPHKCLPYDTKNKNFLFVHLSAMMWEGFELEDLPFQRVSENRINVCFPTHCSRSELIYFISYFSPKKVDGFPNEYKMEITENQLKVVFKAPKRRFHNESRKKKVKKQS